MKSGIKKTYHFLHSDGEMGNLTRSFNWASTPLGAPEHWPQSLKSTVAMILSSKFPMFLFWGDKLVQFYNDAYRPSLGNNGKHPIALGQKAVECWPETWDLILPLIEQVKTTGVASWHEEQRMPIFRNGKMEDVYWTFSYSPVIDDTGEIGGVLVMCQDVTKDVLARKKNAIEKDRATLAIDVAELGVYELDLVTNEVTTDARFDEIYGFEKPAKREEYVSLMHPDDLLIRAAAEKKIFSEGWYNYEVRIVPKGKNMRWIRSRGKLIYNDKNKPVKISGVVQDITPQMQSHKALQESEQNLRNTILQAPVAMCIFKGPTFIVELANKRMFAIWGKTSEEMSGKPIFEGLPEAKDQGFEELLTKVYKTGESFIANNIPLVLPRDGKKQTLFINLLYEAYRESDGTISGVLAVAIEITEQVAARKKIEEAEEKALLAINSADLGVYEIIYATNEMITDLRFKEIWGVSLDVTREEYAAVIHPDDRAHRQLAHENSLKTGELYYEARVIWKDGSIHWAGISGTVIYDEKKNAIKLIGVVQDITDAIIAKNKIEEIVEERTKELEEANNSLERSNSELAQFAYIASHDLQEPLRKISTFAQLLQENLVDSDQKSHSYLDKITSASVRMTALIRDVLTYSQLSKEHEVFEPVNLNEILKTIKNDFELVIEQKQAVVESTNLPVIQAIPLQMSQLFSNIISNGLKYSREGICPHVTITANKMTQEEVISNLLLNPAVVYYRIQFTDNGIGFKDEHAEQIFNIFQRLHRKNEYAGTGIGLAICKKIARNHHGDISAKAGTEYGAVFTVILPLK